MRRVHREPRSRESAHSGGITQRNSATRGEERSTSTIDNSPLMAAQRQKLQTLFGSAIQRQVLDEETATPGEMASVQRVEGETSAAESNNTGGTGLPANLKNGIESLSGLSMEEVKVHYNSSQPAQLNALAYAQGTDIHVAPGQEQHLPHEAWHVVQQAQGRVKPTMQMKGDLPVNDDKVLEHEADVMGARAATLDHSNPANATASIAAAATQCMPVAQMAWASENYKVSNGDRTLHVDTKTVSWGATVKNQFVNHRDDGARPRALLYETMGRPTDVAGLLAAFAQAPIWDVGLSLVVNRPYTPPKIYKKDTNTVTGASRTVGDSVDTAKANLANDWAAITNAWNGPPLQVTIAAWERREVENDGGSGLEMAQGSVPYSTLRRVAATNPGAAEIDTELYSNHSSVWRKMGDSDMPVIDPNDGGSPEIETLKEVEDEGGVYAKNTLVTFGYNLTTPGASPIVASILTGIYKKEMELRDKIGELGAPLYPSEPTTYYRPRAQGSMDDVWGDMEGERVGGSGQQLEGAKLARAMEKNGGMQHIAKHSVAANTGAGGRNDALVRLLEGWWQNGNGNHDDVETSKIAEEINNLDQCALRDGEYLGKVPTNLGKELEQYQFEAIKKLVTQYRKEAAVNAAFALVTALSRGKKWG